MHTKITKKQAFNILQKVGERVNKEIAILASHDYIAAGLSCQGYAGGYRDALSDVILMLTGTRPTRRDWWEHI